MAVEKVFAKAGSCLWNMRLIDHKDQYSPLMTIRMAGWQEV